MTALEVGKKITIYEDPYTRQYPEGDAEIRAILSSSEPRHVDGRLSIEHRVVVWFEGDGEDFTRLVIEEVTR